MVQATPPVLTGCNDQSLYFARWYRLVNRERIPIQVNVTIFPPAALHVVDSCNLKKCYMNSKSDTNKVVVDPTSEKYLVYFSTIPPPSSTLHLLSRRVPKIVVASPVVPTPQAQTRIGITKIPTSVFCGLNCKIQVPSFNQHIKIGECQNKIKQISAVCDDAQHPLTFSLCKNGYTIALLSKKSGKCSISLVLDKETSVSLRRYKEETKTKVTSKYFEETIAHNPGQKSDFRNYSIAARRGETVRVFAFNEKNQPIAPIFNKDNTDQMKCGPNGICTMYKAKKKHEKVDVCVPTKNCGTSRIVVTVVRGPFKLTKITQMPRFLRFRREQTPFFKQFFPMRQRKTRVLGFNDLGFQLPSFALFRTFDEIRKKMMRESLRFDKEFSNFENERKSIFGEIEDKRPQIAQDAPKRNVKNIPNESVKIEKTRNEQAVKHNDQNVIKKVIENTDTRTQVFNEYKEGESKQYIFISIGAVVFVLVVGVVVFIFRPTRLFS
ncbi:hypothetical protein EIN_380700 [Entamoeba invadens IP1]|uniref:Uncharacterized protein n=2 Tax=Entamoeba invadens TaxID=33085 RepID=A0A0A1UAM2_ENTIV|nr:hypothetical protein EIN_380700 [Entamoeba invadens IP1]ELP92123.1 hypothetical protein EIN_380700 [Entamoeba invadens IP1]|eukprot:XP_004258894.1 hypothetical protein EIN_380700 [Entamoeba invadens IP1]